MSSSLSYQRTPTPVVVDASGLLFWLALAASAGSVLLGILVIAWPDATLKVTAVLFGAWLVAHGILRILQAILVTAADTASRALAAVIGVLFVIAGILCLRNLLASVSVVVTLIGLAWLLIGIVELGSALVGRGSRAERTWGAALPGLLATAGGIALLAWPDITLRAMIYLGGAWLIAMGLVQILIILRVRRAAAV